QALIHDKAHVTTPGNVVVKALDNSDVDADAAGLAVSLGIGVGASLGLNDVNSTVLAGIDDATVTANSGSITIDAKAQPTPSALALGGAGAGFVAAVGTITSNVTHNSTEASISGGAVVNASGPISIQAHDTSALVADSGNMSVAGFADVG